MKKIIILTLLISSPFFYRPAFAAYPSSCSSDSQNILNAVGGCLSIDCNSYTGICGKCCIENAQALICTDFSYSDWFACQPNGIQTRMVVSKYPAGCTNKGVSITSRSCTPPASTEILTATSTGIFIPTPTSISTSTIFLTPTLTVSKNDIASGDTVDLSFSGPANISKFMVYFSCPKFSSGPESGTSAASVKIHGADYCNKDFIVPADTKDQSVIILNKTTKAFKITVRLNAFNSEEQYVGFKEAAITVQKQTIQIPSVFTSTPLAPKIVPEIKVASSTTENDLLGSKTDLSTTSPSEIATTSQNTEPIIALIEFIKKIFTGIFRIFGLGE